MEFLFIDFAKNNNSSNQRRSDFFNTTLQEQYEKILMRMQIGTIKVEDFSRFINILFPNSIEQNYYFSMPNFNRDNVGDIYNNVVLRPQKNSTSTYYLPKGMNLILIGDIFLKGKFPSFTVKGIELIDENVITSGEKVVRCAVSASFSTRTFYNERAGKEMTVPDYGVRDEAPLLTRDFILDLVDNNFTVDESNLGKVFEVEKHWKEYLGFRKYYLNKQSEQAVEVDNVTVVEAYSMPKSNYRYRKDELSQNLLDGIQGMEEGEQVILGKSNSDSELFPMVRVVINKNRKDILADKDKKSGKPKFEMFLSRFTKQSTGLTHEAPEFDKYTGKLKVRSLNLEERFRKVFHIDIEPSYDKINNTYENNKKKEFSSIDNKYAILTSSEVDKFVQSKKQELEKIETLDIDKFTEQLNSSLQKDVVENKDTSVKVEYNKIIAEHQKKIYGYIDGIKKSYKQKIEKAKGNGKVIISLESMLKEKLATINEDFARIPQEANLENLYKRRNANLIDNYIKTTTIKTNQELVRLREGKEKELKQKYASKISEEKKQADERLSAIRDRDIDTKRETETVRQYIVYFKIEQDNHIGIGKEIVDFNPRFMVYNNVAELSKITRQEDALKSFFGGYVKNPFLSSYLFCPESLSMNNTVIKEDLDWNLKSLNPIQKSAVQKAINSESLFLLQGPPGTGKTQVIAEIVAQLCKKGKKVLISSETHKAIDNVYDRLPKIPEIRPLRLIPSWSGKKSRFGIENLTDNFYLNITDRLDRQVKTFENYTKTKENFSEEMGKLKLLYTNLLATESTNKNLETEIKKETKKKNELISEQEALRPKIADIKETQEELNFTLKSIKSFRFASDDLVVSVVKHCMDSIKTIQSKYTVFKDVDLNKLQGLFEINPIEVRKELASLNVNEVLIALEKKKAIIKSKMVELCDPDTEEPYESKENEYNRLRGEFISLGKQIKAEKSKSNIDLSELKIGKLINLTTLSGKEMDNLSSSLENLQNEIRLLFVEIENIIENKNLPLNESLRQLEDVENKLKGDIFSIDDKIEELKESSDYNKFKETESKLRQGITTFFSDFNIVKTYSDYREALDIIKEEWKELDRNFENRQKENKEKIPMYQKICKYLRDDSILEEDRKRFTKKLYDNANVYGITCTSRDSFNEKSIQELIEYGIKEIDIKGQGIDVVIIDEVSKSSFLDLLIPILYGKTVILVGDHRQLPPMYDLRNLRGQDFEGLDENVINESINKEYTALYEECFFKTLFDNVPPEFKSTLNYQYRCHEQIMKIFNHFYDGKLKLGAENQNDIKQHNLNIKTNGKTVIEQGKHVYFIDCDGFSVEDYSISSSSHNPQEADVVIALLDQINNAYGNMKSNGRFVPRIDKERCEDERASVGVICTYGDQAGHIKRKLQGKISRYKNFNEQDKLVVSTVDDFQGDERDIIIVSMTKNPKKRTGTYDFLRKFERINVAFSRARKMLIIVGNKDFLSDKGVIDLPSLDNPNQVQYGKLVYREIIASIEEYGKMLRASDILEVR